MEGESQLGLQTYWEAQFLQELESLGDTEDYDSACETWFGQLTQRKVHRLLIKHVPLSAQVIDIGCGNGCSLEQFRAQGFRQLYGFDYSMSAVEIARLRVPEAVIEEGDIVTWVYPGQTTCSLALLHDKGTFDAFLLNPEHTFEQYSTTLAEVATHFESVWFMITSCNNTYEELRSKFYAFEEIEHVEDFPRLEFGGSQGTTLAAVLFKIK